MYCSDYPQLLAPMAKDFVRAPFRACILAVTKMSQGALMISHRAKN